MFSLHLFESCTIFICFLTSDVTFDHLIKAMFTRLLDCEVTLLPFVINKYFVGKQPIFIIKFSPTRFSILTELTVSMIVSKCLLCTIIILSVFIIWHSTVRKNLSSPYLFVSAWSHE